MSINKAYKFRSLDELEYFLNGALRGADIKSGVSGLNGLTLTFTTPAGAVTFGDSTQVDKNFYQLNDIKAQIEAAIPTLRVLQANGVLIFVLATPTTGVVLSGNNEPAKRILGFDQNSTSVGKLYAPPGTSPPVAPAWTWIDSTGENQYLVITLE